MLKIKYHRSTLAGILALSGTFPLLAETEKNASPPLTGAGEERLPLYPDPPPALLRVEHFTDTFFHSSRRYINELVDRGLVQTDQATFDPESPISTKDVETWSSELLGPQKIVIPPGATVSLEAARTALKAFWGEDSAPPLFPEEDLARPLTRARAAEWLLMARANPTRHAMPVTAGNIFVSMKGNDEWSGRLAEPNADGTDGPVASPSVARDRLRTLRHEGHYGDAVVLFRGGYYPLKETLEFSAEDGAIANETITYRNYADEEVILSGGVEVTGWTLKEERPEGKIWKAAIPAGQESVRQLFANTQRLPRARFPDVGYLTIDAVDNAQSPKRLNLSEALPGGPLESKAAEFISLSYWSSRRETIVRSGKNWVEGETHMGSAPFFLMMSAAGNSGFVENDPTLLNRPWEWCSVPETGELLLMLPPDQDVAGLKIIAPIVERLVRIAGDESRPVKNLRFQGITFAYSAATMPKAGISEFQATFYTDNHAEKPVPSRVDRLYTLPPAVEVTYGIGNVFQDVRLVHLGNQGINFGEGARYSSLIGSEVTDVGATGVMIGSREIWGEGSAATNDQDGRSDWSRAAQVPYANTISDNKISDCGRIVFGGVGIWAGYTKFTTISYNDVFRLPYSGISFGWSFHSGMTSMEYPTIKDNHVRDVMRILTDGGGIYVLGYQPGGVMIGNIIHDVWRNPTVSGFYAHGLYFDEASRFWKVEENEVYDTFDDLNFNNYLRGPSWEHVDFSGNTLDISQRVGGESWLVMANNKFGETPPTVIKAGVRPFYLKPARPNPPAPLFPEEEIPKERIIGEKTIGNGDFEKDTLSGWRPLNASLGTVTIVNDPQTARNGNGFLRLKRRNFADPLLSNPLILRKSKRYRLQAWLRLTDSAPTTFRVYIETSGREILKDMPVAPGVWTLLETEFTVPKNTNSPLVFQTLDPASGIVPFDLDDVSVTEIKENNFAEP